MNGNAKIFFLPFQLDVANEQLWREEQLVPLRPKTFALLRYLAEHPSRLVIKEELLRAVWGETQVSEEGLRDYLREIRPALCDDANAPRFVETVRGRGYRFLPATTTQPVSSSRFQVPSSPSSPTPHPQSLTLSEALPLPDKPSIIVLPFLNLSNDPEQEYFSDGITEDITNSLSRLSTLFVISRTSAFSYKGKSTKVQDISREMGVQYVLEGSVRRADNQIRVTAQLIDAIADRHLWSERYDRPLTDIFAVQDEIVQKLVTTLDLHLTVLEQGACFKARKVTSNIVAYDAFMRGVNAYTRFTKDANLQARQLAKQAIELASQYADAYALSGWTYWNEWQFQWSQDPQLVEQAFTLARRAKALDDFLPPARELLSYIFLWRGQEEQAVAEAKQTTAVKPSDAHAHFVLGVVLMSVGRPEEAIEKIQQAMRLDPHYPGYMLSGLGAAYALIGRYEEARTALHESVARNPEFLTAHVLLAALYSRSGCQEEARMEATEVLRISPHFSLEGWRQRSVQRDPTALEGFFAALRRAGLE